MKKKTLIRIQRLHLFCDNTETLSAFDENDAFDMREEWSGQERSDDDDPFYLIPDGRKWEVLVELDEYDGVVKEAPLFSKCWKDKDFGHIEAPAWAWALQGRGYVSGTEF